MVVQICARSSPRVAGRCGIRSEHRCVHLASPGVHGPGPACREGIWPWPLPLHRRWCGGCRDVFWCAYPGPLPISRTPTCRCGVQGANDAGLAIRANPTARSGVLPLHPDAAVSGPSRSGAVSGRNALTTQVRFPCTLAGFAHIALNLRPITARNRGRSGRAPFRRVFGISHTARPMTLKKSSLLRSAHFCWI